jgi:hypothetical protein
MRQSDLMPTTTNENTVESWQFSLRSLLAFVSIVSILLAIGVHYAGAVVALVVWGLFQAGMLVSADWLIQPAHRRALAFLTAASWAIAGSSFVALALFALNGLDDFAGSWAGALLLYLGGAFCYFLAALRWRQLTRSTQQ